MNKSRGIGLCVFREKNCLSHFSVALEKFTIRKDQLIQYLTYLIRQVKAIDYISCFFKNFGKGSYKIQLQEHLVIKAVEKNVKFMCVIRRFEVILGIKIVYQTIFNFPLFAFKVNPKHSLTLRKSLLVSNFRESHALIYENKIILSFEQLRETYTNFCNSSFWKSAILKISHSNYISNSLNLCQ
jgi:hypothetical protein